MNNYELKIEPYMKDLSAVSDYLDCAEFQLLTQIAVYLDSSKEPILIMPSTLITTLDFTKIMTVGVFKTIIFSKEIVGQIKKSNTVKLEFVGPEDLINVLDMKVDEFNTSGLQDIYSKLDNSCK